MADLTIDQMRAEMNESAVMPQNVEIPADIPMGTQPADDLESMRAEMESDELATMPGGDYGYPGKSAAEYWGETAADTAIGFTQSLPVITPASHHTIAAYRAIDPSQDYRTTLADVQTYSEEALRRARERSPYAAPAAIFAAQAITPGLKGGQIYAKALYEAGLAGVDAILRSRSTVNALAEGGVAGALTAALPQIKRLAKYLPGADKAPDFVNNLFAWAHRKLSSGGRYSTEDVAELYKSVEGRRAYKQLEATGSMGAKTESVAKKMQTAFRDLQDTYGGMYGRLKKRFITDDQYMDFETAERTKNLLLSDIADIKKYPHQYNSKLIKELGDISEMFKPDGFRSEYGKAYGKIMTPEEISKKYMPWLNQAKKQFEKAKTEKERTVLTDTIALIEKRAKIDMTRSNQLTKEALLKARRRIDGLTKELTKDPEKLATRKDDLSVLADFRRSIDTAVKNDYVRSQDLVRGDLIYTAYKEATEDLYNFLKKPKAKAKGEFITVDPKALRLGMTSTQPERLSDFNNALEKFTDFIQADDELLESAVKQAKVEPMFKDLTKLMSAYRAKTLSDTIRYGQGPSGQAVKQAVRTGMAASDSKRAAFAVFLMPLLDPVAWTNLVDDLAMGVKRGKTAIKNPGMFRKAWQMSAGKFAAMFPEFIKHPIREFDDLMVKGVGRTTRMMTSPMGMEHVDYDYQKLLGTPTPSLPLLPEKDLPENIWRGIKEAPVLPPLIPEDQKKNAQLIPEPERRSIPDQVGQFIDDVTMTDRIGGELPNEQPLPGMSMPFASAKKFKKISQATGKQISKKLGKVIDNIKNTYGSNTDVAQSSMGWFKAMREAITDFPEGGTTKAAKKLLDKGMISSQEANKLAHDADINYWRRIDSTANSAQEDLYRFIEQQSPNSVLWITVKRAFDKHPKIGDIVKDVLENGGQKLLDKGVNELDVARIKKSIEGMTVGEAVNKITKSKLSKQLTPEQKKALISVLDEYSDISGRAKQFIGAYKINRSDPRDMMDLFDNEPHLKILKEAVDKADKRK